MTEDSDKIPLSLKELTKEELSNTIPMWAKGEDGEIEGVDIFRLIWSAVLHKTKGDLTLSDVELLSSITEDVISKINVADKNYVLDALTEMFMHFNTGPCQVFMKRLNEKWSQIPLPEKPIHFLNWTFPEQFRSQFDLMIQRHFRKIDISNTKPGKNRRITRKHHSKVDELFWRTVGNLTEEGSAYQYKDVWNAIYDEWHIAEKEECILPEKNHDIENIIIHMDPIKMGENAHLTWFYHRGNCTGTFKLKSLSPKISKLKLNPPKI